MNQTILIILLIISIITSISSVFINKSILNSIRFPIFYTFAINLIIFLFINSTRFILDYPPSGYENARMYSSFKWLVGFFESLKEIFINLSLKHNPVILDQIIPMINLTTLLFLYVFFLSSIRSNNNQDKKNKNLAIPSFISFLIFSFGLFIYVHNNPEIKFSPGIIYGILSLIFYLVCFVLRVVFVIYFREIDGEEMNNFGKADMFALLNEIIKGSIRFHRLIIFEKTFCILLACFIFESKFFHQFWDQIFEFDEMIKYNSNLFFCLILASVFSAYDIVYKVIERCSLSSTSTLKKVINGFYFFSFKFIVIIIALTVYKKYPNTSLGVVLFMIGYIFYVIFESICFYNVALDSLPDIINYINTMIPDLAATINPEELPILHTNNNNNINDPEIDPNSNEQNNDIIN